MQNPAPPIDIHLLFLLFFIANLVIWFDVLAGMSLLLACGR